MNKQQLEDRLIEFSTCIVKLSNSLSKSQAGVHLSNQIMRSGTSVSLNYGEARAAESKKDFIHKMKVILKELRETFVCIKLIDNCDLHKNNELIQEAKNENNELITIFVKSIKTANSIKISNR